MIYIYFFACHSLYVLYVLRISILSSMTNDKKSWGPSHCNIFTHRGCFISFWLSFLEPLNLLPFPKGPIFQPSFNSAKSFWLKLARDDFCSLWLKNRLNRVKSKIINNQRLGSQQYQSLELSIGYHDTTYLKKNHSCLPGSSFVPFLLPT